MTACDHPLMMSRLRPISGHRRLRLPMAWWLLVTAWICINCPQAAIYGMADWFGQARHFSHQQRLTTEVAALLVQDPAVSQPVKIQSAPSKTPAPAIPAEAVLKKIEIFLTRAFAVRVMDVLPIVYPPVVGGCPEPRVEPPPHGPPRMGFC